MLQKEFSKYLCGWGKKIFFASFFLSLASLIPAYAQEDSPFFGKTISWEGEVLVTRGIIEFELKSEEDFRFDDEIETGENGRLQLSFGSSYISVGPNTIFSIDRRKEGGNLVTSITLDEGRFRSKVFLDDGEGYEVVSEVGTVRVTGTDFVTAFSPDSAKGFNVTVIKGSVGVESSENEESSRSSQSMNLGANESGGVSDKGRTSDVVAVPPSTIAQIKKDLPLPGDSDEKQVDEQHGGPDDQTLTIPETAVAVAPPLTEINVATTLQQVFEIAPAPAATSSSSSGGQNNNQQQQQGGTTQTASTTQTTETPAAETSVASLVTLDPVIEIPEETIAQVTQAVSAVSENITESVGSDAVQEVNSQIDAGIRLQIKFEFQVD